MRSLETVARERMEVAVCFPIGDPLFMSDSDTSNKYLSGEKPPMRTSLTSPTSSVSCSTRLVSSRISMLIDMINTASP